MRQAGPTSAGSPTCWSGPGCPAQSAVSVRAKLFLIVDDHSRLLVHGRFFAHENARACQELLRRAIVRRGLPEVLYADNGAPFANAWLARTCAVLGVRLVHSKPYSPEGRGKQERSTATSARRSWPRPPITASTPSTSSTTCSPPGPSRWPTAGPTPRPARPRSTGSRRRPAAAGRPRPAGRGVPLVGHPQGDPHRHRPARGQRLCRRPRARRPAGRAALRPRGPDPHRRLLRGPAGRRGHAVRHPPPRAPRRPPGPPSRPRPDRRRLPRPGRRRPRGAAGTGAKIDFSQLAMLLDEEQQVEPGPVGGALRAGPHPFGKAIPAKDLFGRQPTPRPSPASASAWWSRPWA